MRELLRSIVIVAIVCGWIQTELVRADEIPSIPSIAKKWAKVNESFSFTVCATGDPAPTYSLMDSPSGMTIAPATGIITWIPIEEQIGTWSVTIRATNSVGSSDGTFKVEVPVPPRIAPIPDQTAIVNHKWQCSLQVTGSGNPAPSTSLTVRPSGMSITGTFISWKPTVTQVGTHDVTVKATSSTGSDSKSFKITVSDDGEPRVFTLKALSASVVGYPDCPGSVTSPGEGFFRYPEGTIVPITATANNGYHFLIWVGSGVDAGKVDNRWSPSTTIIMHADYNIEARFEANQTYYHKLSIWSTLGGTVVKPGVGYFDYAPDSTATIIARADSGYRFSGWTGTAVEAGRVADVTSSETTVAMNADYSLAAQFEPLGSVVYHTLTVSSGDGGHVSSPGEGGFQYDEGTNIPIRALADSGYRFVGWSGSAVDAGKVANPASDSTTVRMSADFTLIASFGALGDPVTLTLASTDGGRVSLPGEGLFTCRVGDDVTVVAQADAGYQFSRWTGSAVDACKVANPASDSTTVRMLADFTLVASFQPSAGPAMLMLSSTNGGEVSMPGEGVFSCLDGEDVAIAAQASAGYQFSRWTGTAVDAGKVANPASASTYVTMDGDHSLCANFAPTGQGSISVSVVTPNGGERLTPGSTIPVTWQTQGILTHLNIELSVDGGSTWTQILYHSGAGSSFDWAVPAADSERCLIRVSDPENPSVSDTSDAPFSIRTVASRIWYVDAAAAGRADGTSWADAFICLQDALSRALDGDSVLVAEGVYSPDLGEGWDVGDRTATFQLGNGVALYGGFPTGGGEWLRRNPAVHRSILSGDIGTLGVAADNSYHIVTAGKVTKTAVLDGCTVSDGYADGADPYDRGAGLYSLSGSPQIRNCTFLRNAAPAGYGGGACNTAGGATFINCVFTGNTAGNCGGGLYIERGAVTLINCTLTANQGLWRGGGVFTFGGTVTIANSILWGNGRQNGFRYDEGAQADGDLQPAMDHCCVQGWTGSTAGEGCSARDPLFVNAAGPDKVVGTLDDDLRLLPGSSCIDAGATVALPPGITTDLQGRSRTHNHIVDIGAYEFHGDD